MMENEILKAIQKLDNKFEKRFNTVDHKIETLQQDMSSVKTDVSTLQQDMSSVKTDVSTLQQDMSSVKTDVSTLQQDVSKVSIEFDEFRGVLGDVHQLEKENRRDIKEIKSDLTNIKNKLFLHEIAIKKAI